MSDKDTELKLKQFRAKVAKSKDELSNLKGQQKALLSRLTKEFNIGSVKGAKKHLERLKARAEKLEKEVAEKLTHFETKYKDILNG